MPQSVEHGTRFHLLTNGGLTYVTGIFNDKGDPVVEQRVEGGQRYDYVSRRADPELRQTPTTIFDQARNSLLGKPNHNAIGEGIAFNAPSPNLPGSYSHTEVGSRALVEAVNPRIAIDGVHKLFTLPSDQHQRLVTAGQTPPDFSVKTVAYAPSALPLHGPNPLDTRPVLDSPSTYSLNERLRLPVSRGQESINQKASLIHFSENQYTPSPGTPGPAPSRYINASVSLMDGPVSTGQLLARDEMAGQLRGAGDLPPDRYREVYSRYNGATNSVDRFLDSNNVRVKAHPGTAAALAGVTSTKIGLAPPREGVPAAAGEPHGQSQAGLRPTAASGGGGNSRSFKTTLGTSGGLASLLLTAIPAFLFQKSIRDAAEHTPAGPNTGTGLSTQSDDLNKALTEAATKRRPTADRPVNGM